MTTYGMSIIPNSANITRFDYKKGDVGTIDEKLQSYIKSGSNVSAFADNCFINCIGLTSVNGNGIKYIGEYALRYAHNVKNLDFNDLTSSDASFRDMNSLETFKANSLVNATGGLFTNDYNLSSVELNSVSSLGP